MGLLRRLQNHPAFLEKVYDLTHTAVAKLQPLIAKIGYERTNRLIKGGEEWGKGAIFDCQMCGQCILHSTGMTCPMTCPKNLRNGPCGGVRANGHCEVKPEMKCVWVEAFERSRVMPTYGDEILHIQPPVNRQLEGESAWVTMLTGADKTVPKGWVGTSTITVIGKQ
ncbi:methylenetetrahydrofolate reductase C-terminal domain-containing protein [Candidatus Leptofilum sp.]|uniref:methylenetetrahydrofolate reductase C-terminal domain-containing protein n=1 Tax=Candidatus Leptofilum sp. TaxID=3241576 RepID=UPI003B5B3FC7